MENLSAILHRLREAQVEFVLVGGFAVASYGVPLVTQDVDVCCRFTEENLRRLESALSGLHPVHRMKPDLPFTVTPQFCAGLKNVYLKTDLGVLDCLGSVLGIGDYDEVFRRSIEVEISGGSIRIIALEALIEAKQAMGRPRDVMAVQMLEHVRNPKPL